MRLRSRASTNDEAFDGLTAEEIRRIRGAAAASITPGLEGLIPTDPPGVPDPMPETKRKRGRRA